jgi:hypothetical protein
MPITFEGESWKLYGEVIFTRERERERVREALLSLLWG